MSPATLPLDAFDSPVPPASWLGNLDETVIVPGSVTWYKRPGDAVEWAVREGFPRIVFCGPDDGSGCWLDVQRRAARAGVEVTRLALARPELLGLMQASAVVALPSELETLGFSMAEALLVARRVAARPIPAHLEVARRVGGAVTWTFVESPELPAAAVLRPVDELRHQVREEWRGVAREMLLRPST